MESCMEDNTTALDYDLANNASSPSILRHSTEWTALFVVIYALIFFTGLIGNGMLVVVLYRKRQMHSVTYTFIFNLAVADLLVIVLCVPATLTASIFTPWLLGSFMCKAMPYVQGVSVCASAYSLVAISVDRCQGMYRPMRRGQGFSSAQANTCIILIWTLSLLITCPWLFVYQVIPRDGIDEGPFCIEIWENPLYGQIYYVLCTLLCCYVLPLLLISISNLLIWWKVSRRKLPQHVASTTCITQLHRKTKLEVRKMLTVVTFTFILCWLPLYVIVSRIALFKNTIIDDQESQILNVVIPLAQLLGSFNSCVNPIIYAFVNTKFRKMFKSLLPYSRPCSPSISSRSARLQRNHTVVVRSSRHSRRRLICTRFSFSVYGKRSCCSGLEPHRGLNSTRNFHNKLVSLPLAVFHRSNERREAARDVWKR